MVENENKKTISNYIKDLLESKNGEVDENYTFTETVKAPKESDSQTVNYTIDVDHNGVTVFLKGWLPSEPSDKPPLVVVHDFGESSVGYRKSCKMLADQGFEVYSFDLRGHGRNGNFSAIETSVEAYVNDLLQISNWVKFKSDRKKPIILTQGLSSLFVSLFAERFSSYIAGLVLFSPIMILEKEPSLWWRASINTMREVFPDRSIPRRFLPDFLTVFDRDIESSKSFYFTSQLVYEFLVELEESKDNFAKLDSDVAMFYGAKKSQISYDEICRRINTHHDKTLFNLYSMDESITHPLSSDVEKIDSIMSHLTHG